MERKNQGGDSDCMSDMKDGNYEPQKCENTNTMTVTGENSYITQDTMESVGHDHQTIQSIAGQNKPDPDMCQGHDDCASTSDQNKLSQPEKIFTKIVQDKEGKTLAAHTYKDQVILYHYGCIPEPKLEIQNKEDRYYELNMDFIQDSEFPDVTHSETHKDMIVHMCDMVVNSNSNSITMFDNKG